MRLEFLTKRHQGIIFRLAVVAMDPLGIAGKRELAAALYL